MSDDTRFDEILEALQAAGLTELFLDEDGDEAMRLTAEGAALARELAILEHGSGPSAPTEAGGSGEPTPTQLGFEQALRSEPPPETVAGEQTSLDGAEGLR
jgi:hypothetical protein